MCPLLTVVTYGLKILRILMQTRYSVCDDGRKWRSDVTTDTKAINELFEILRNKRRRRLCLYMRETDDEIFPFDKLVDYLVRWESKKNPKSGERRDRIATTLHHIHLPKLADFGVIEYDKRSRAVRYEEFPMSNLDDWVEGTSESRSEIRALGETRFDSADLL